MTKIKFIGFISEYHSGILNAMPYEAYFEKPGIEEKYRNRVLGYLKSGVLFSSAMHITEDLLSGESVGPDAYYTDGKWIWPEYMIYYLEHKPNYFIEERFIQDLINRGFKYDKNKINKKKLNFFLSRHMYGWWFAFKTFYLAKIRYRLKTFFELKWL